MKGYDLPTAEAVLAAARSMHRLVIEYVRSQPTLAALTVTQGPDLLGTFRMNQRVPTRGHLIEGLLSAAATVDRIHLLIGHFRVPDSLAYLGRIWRN